ncbi:hypothetical protein HC928_09285 [bacterium]|nr:hypothetical protein [bacterium]
MWSFYGITVAFGLYAHPFSALVSLGHGLYVILVEKWQGRKQIFAGFLSTLMGIVLFLPWLNIVLANFSDFVENTISTSTPRPQLYLLWGLNISRIFFDVNQGTSPLNPTLYLFIGLVGYSIYVLCRQAPPRIWVFLITLMGVTGLALMVPDVVAGGRRSSILRYAVPCVLGIQLTVSYMLASKLTAATNREFRRWKRIAIALIFGGILSCLVSAHVPVWWHKSPAKSRFNPAIADIINVSDRPLVISDEIQGRVLAFLHLLRQDVVVQLVVPPQLPQIPQGFNPIFLYRLSDPAKAALAQATNARLEEAYDRGWLWQLVPNNTSSPEENS